MSAEPARKKAYSVDVRWRVVYQRIGMALPFYKIAKNLSIATSTAHRLFQKFASSGDVRAVQRSCRPELRALDEHSELIIIGLILESPTLYLDEVVQEVKEITSLTVSPPTICRLFKRYGFTRKRVRQIASQRCYPLRGAYMAHCTLFRRDMFVWIDEAGSDARDHIRRFGYALRGMTPASHRLLVRGKRVNAIAALTSSGLLAVDLVIGTVSGLEFFDFLRGTLIPNMMTYNGTNAHSIVIMDNCSVHHIAEVRDLLQQAGILVLFLPPYSPDFNPAEEAFSYVKGYLKKHDQLLQSGAPLSTVVQAAFNSITEDQCNAWITDSGYPL
jgi:transposase